LYEDKETQGRRHPLPLEEEEEEDKPPSFSVSKKGSSQETAENSQL
jgi:hypothetical protein